MPFTRCPKCGESPVQVNGAAPEAVLASVVEMLPEVAAVDHLTCENGHEWFDWEEKEERALD